jgi:hypothetical protein
VNPAPVVAFVLGAAMGSLTTLVIIGLLGFLP